MRGYNFLSTLLHLVIAVGVISMFFIGQETEVEPGSGDFAYARSMLALHISLGLCLILFAYYRVFRRFRLGFAPSASESRALRIASKIVHYGLLINILVAFTTGAMTAMFSGDNLSIFNMVTIPNPVPNMYEVRGFVAEVHEISVKLFIPLLLLHVIGWITNLFRGRDIAKRMIFWDKNGV